MSELLVLLTSAAWLLRTLAAWGRRRQSAADFPSALFFSQLNPLDYGVFVWLALGALSLLWAQQTGKAVTELRTLMIEPALFYLIFRIAARDRKVLLRATDTLLLAGFLVAAIGLLQFVRGEAIITAEEGARRLASVYGSPNNVGLFLGRCIPFLLAFVLVGIDRRRRIVSGIMLGVLLIAVLLTQSAGALLIGIPISVIAVLLLTLGRRGVIAIVALAAAGAVAFAVALRSARFARILDFSEGTNFFRLRVWQSALQMILDHPLTGIGLDQFLYAYRGRYILPDAWQEPNLSHPHNFVLDFWLRLGVAGLIAFFWLQAVFWRQSLRLYRTTRRDPLTFALIVGMIGSMVNLLAHGLVDNSVFVNDLVYVFVLLLGLCANLVSLAKQEQS